MKYFGVMELFYILICWCYLYYMHLTKLIELYTKKGKFYSMQIIPQ